MWVFDVPVAIGLPVFVVIFVALSCLIVIALRRWVRRASEGQGEWDRVLSYAVSAYGIFYGVTLGLIAAGAYGNFTEVNSVVLRESSAVAVLYRSAAFFPDPTSTDLKKALIVYSSAVIADDWPLQQRLIAPEETDRHVTAIQGVIADFEPISSTDTVVQSQTIAAFNVFITDRRERISLTHLALPPMLWIVLGVGALLNAVLLALIEVRNLRIHLIMAGLIASFVAMLLYAIAGFDHPYSGPISVTPEYFRDLLEGLFVREP